MKTQIPWLRVFVEGVVIVGSILLAFGTPVSGQDAPQPDRIQLALSDPAFDWRELETENFRVYYLIQALTPADAEYAGRDLENSLEHNLGLLQEQHDPDPIRALIVGSRDEMAQVIGRPYGGVALPDERAVVFTTGDGYRPATSGRPRFLHELMHLVAYEVWGRPHEPHQWISEGLATFSPGRCAEFTLASLAALMADTGELPSRPSHPSLQDIAYLDGSQPKPSPAASAASAGLARSTLRCKSQLTLWGHASRVPGRGWRGGCAPFDPPEVRAPAERVLMADHRTVTASARVLPVDLADGRAETRGARVSLSALLRQRQGRTRGCGGRPRRPRLGA